MPRYFQVNQPYANRIEFKSEYLCAPDQEIAQWEILKELQIGDIIFNYSSLDKRVFGLSQVMPLGPHKGLEGAKILDESETFRVYEGQHLSLKHMAPDARSAEKERVERYIEVHTKRVEEKYLGGSFFEGRQVYCARIETPMAEKRLGKGPKTESAPKVIRRREPR